MAKKLRQQGELESLVLDALWDSKTPLTSNEVLDVVSENGALALTTVLTVLSRLTDKGLVERSPANGRGFVFAATSTREEYAASQLLEILASSENAALTLSHFAAGLSKKSLNALKKSLE
ncbi:MAG: BlaI/MecI/CopY family transcriptional regulator [Micrococcales bacterium]